MQATDRRSRAPLDSLQQGQVLAPRGGGIARIRLPRAITIAGLCSNSDTRLMPSRLRTTTSPDLQLARVFAESVLQQRTCQHGRGNHARIVLVDAIEHALELRQPFAGGYQPVPRWHVVIGCSESILFLSSTNRSSVRDASLGSALPADCYESKCQCI